MGRVGGRRVGPVVGVLCAALLSACSGGAGLGSGPCFDVPPHDPGATERADCDDARYELVSEETLEGSGLAGWPGRLELATEVHDRCLEVAEAYVGQPLPEVGYDVWFHHPDEAAWTDGDRDIVCAVEDIERRAPVGDGGGDA